MNHDQLSRFALKLYDAVAAPCQIGKLVIDVRPSIGIALCPDDVITAEALMRKADAAMYTAKRAKSRYAFALPGP